MHRQFKDAQSQQQEASEALDSAQLEVTQLKALAAERQKRFVMLNSTFKKKESGFQERAEAAERQVAEAQRQSEAAQAQALDAVKVWFNWKQHGVNFSAALLCVIHCLVEPRPGKSLSSKKQ